MASLVIDAAAVVSAHPVLSKYPRMCELLGIAYQKYCDTVLTLDSCIAGAYLTWLHTEQPSMAERTEVSLAIEGVFPKGLKD